jgi:hypothetical protein
MDENILCNANIFKVYFTPHENEENMFRCNACSAGARAHKHDQKKGFTNLANHVKRMHTDWDKVLLRTHRESCNEGDISGFVKRQVSGKATNIFRWLEQCVMNNE